MVHLWDYSTWIRADRTCHCCRRVNRQQCRSGAHYTHWLHLHLCEIKVRYLYLAKFPHCEITFSNKSVYVRTQHLVVFIELITIDIFFLLSHSPFGSVHILLSHWPFSHHCFIPVVMPEHPLLVLLVRCTKRYCMYSIYSNGLLVDRYIGAWHWIKRQ